MLEFTPDSIVFTENEEDGVTLQVRNTLSDSLVGFKFMLTNPKAYAVKPRMGVIKPNESIEVSIFGNKNAQPKDKFRVQGIPLEVEVQEQELEQMFKDPNNKKLLKNHALPLHLPGSVQQQQQQQQQQQYQQADSSAESESTRQQQQSDASSTSTSSETEVLGGWGGWFSSTVANVVNTVQDSANAIGTKIQHFVEDELSENPTQPDQQQQQQQQQQQEAAAREEESVFLDVIETAEKSFFSFVDWGKTTFEKVTDANEIQNLKKAASDLTKSTKTATLNLYEQIATNLGIKDRDALMMITFEDLFNETGGARFYEDLNSLSLKSQTRLEAVLSKMSVEDRKKAMTLMKMIETILQVDECYSKTITVSGDIQSTQNGRELLELFERATSTCNKVVENYREVCANDNLMEQLQTGVIVVEKLRTEFLRTLALIAAKNFEHVSQLSHAVYSAKNIEELEIPKNWISEEQLQKDKDLSKYELLAHCMRNYSLFSTSHVVQVAQVYVQTAQSIQSIVDAEAKKLADDQDNDTELANHGSKLKSKIDELLTSLIERDVQQYTSKDNSVVRESSIFFTHVLKSATASSLLKTEDQTTTAHQDETTSSSAEQVDEQVKSE